MPPPPDLPPPDPPPPYRLDPLTGDVAYVVAKRQGRPNLPSEGCPFCPGGLEAPEPYDVRWFPNRWPPLPDARAELVLYTPIHDATFWSIGTDGARRVVDLWAERSAALGARDDVACVLVFENRGPEVGATIAHPHGQIYGFEVIPPRVIDEIEATSGGDDDALGASAAGADDERLVARHGSWRCWVPEAAAWPYELVAAPTGDVDDLPSLDDAGRDDLASLLVDVFGRLDGLFDAEMPSMRWFHQRPFVEGRPGPRLHLHVTPTWRSAETPRFVAAGELGGHVYFNPVDPVDAAEELRRAEAPRP